MKRGILIFGLILLLAGVASAQNQRTYSKIVAEGTTYTSFGNYTIKVGDQPVMLEGEKVTCYQVTYDKSPVSIEILVDEEVNCKNYIVTSEGLSVMYSCNGSYFGVNLIDKKYSKEGYVTDETYLDHLNYFHQKILARGKQEEIPAASLIACYYPLLNTKK
jgi:hypothetical protein